MTPDVVIYGSYGYTGELIVAEALRAGLQPRLVGRDGERVAAQAARAGLTHAVASLEDPGALDAALAGAKVVIHCAGPFSRTSKPMADAAIRQGVHYLDITGEINVFEALIARDAEAKRAGVMLLPGAGFDVVPTDSLAVHLARRLPDATHLTIAFTNIGGSLSHGTATTAVENLHPGGAVRRDGQLVAVPSGSLVREVDFGRGPRLTMAIPWGDVSTAWFSTGIRNIEVYLQVPPAAARSARLGARVGWLLASRPVQRLLKAVVDRRPAGPTAEERARGFSLLWGEVRDSAGHAVSAHMRTPDGYTLTALSAVLIARRVLGGEAPAGFQTVSTAYGPDLVLELPGVARSDEPLSAG
jgi:short subunit dehydrogenase-like uncharacterized protein